MTNFIFWGTVISLSVGLLSFGYLSLPLASDYPLPQEFIDGIELIVGYMKSFSFIFPFDSLFNVLAIAMAFHFGMFIWERMWKIIAFIRGVGTGTA